MGSPSASPATALPEALTAQILQHVPHQQRLQQCALACNAWASAAALATSHIEQKFKPGQDISAFESWLQQHAGQLESLQLSNEIWGEKHALQLPWAKLAKLQRLQLQGFNLMLPGDEHSNTSTPSACAGASSSSNCEEGTPPAPLLLPSMQHLQLSSVQLNSVSSLLQLAVGPGLTSLKTHDIRIAEFGSGYVSYSEGSAQQVAAAISGLLQQLPRLTVLELPHIPMSAAAVQQLGCMQGLQEVFIEHVDHMPACDLQHLPSSITQLQFHGNVYGAGSGLRLPPQLQHLTRLLQLYLQDCVVQPAVLGSLTSLQVLHLQYCPLPSLNNDDEGYDTEGTAALLDVLSKMTCLQDLCLSLTGVDTVSTAPQRFAALTASTQLTRLELGPDDYTPLPKGAVQYMFPAGRQLPCLQVLNISPIIDWRTDFGTGDEWCIDGADICSIANCCTGLQELSIGNSVKPGADLSGLLELPQSLRSLAVGGAAFGDAAVPVLVQVTQLKDLRMHNSQGFTDAGLQQLTDMDLMGLDVYGCALSDTICVHGAVELQWDSYKGSVQQQLEELCDLSPVCAPARLKRQKEANAQLRVEVEILRMQLQRSQAQIQRLQQQQQQDEAAQAAGQD